MHFEDRPVRRGLGLTPLIDVVFLLLIFFMLTTRFGSDRHLPLRLAVESFSATANHDGGGDRGGELATSDAKPDALVVRLGADGMTWLSGEVIDSRALTPSLAEALATEPSRHVVVTAEAAVSVQRIVSALQGVGGAGARAVSLAQAH